MRFHRRRNSLAVWDCGQRSRQDSAAREPALSAPAAAAKQEQSAEHGYRPYQTWWPPLRIAARLTARLTAGSRAGSRPAHSEAAACSASVMTPSAWARVIPRPAPT